MNIVNDNSCSWLNDNFLKDLYIDDFIKVCDKTGQKLLVTKYLGYDYGYYFINSFIEEYIDYHVSILKNVN